MANLPELWSGSPFRRISRLQRQIDRLFDEFSDWGKVETAFAPPVDIEEKEDRYQLTFDLPGVKKDEIRIEIRGNQLHVAGERAEKKEQKEGKGHFRTERFYGQFERIFPLPADVKAEQIEAAYENGVLSISIPKTAGSNVRQVQIADKKKEAA